jgi:hypothetical protein
MQTERIIAEGVRFIYIMAASFIHVTGWGYGVSPGGKRDKERLRRSGQLQEM